MRARLVWGRLGTLLKREGVDPRVLAIFYRAVAQAILLYGLETWFLLAAMKNKVEGSHTGFIRHITGKRAQWMVDRAWETPGAGAEREAVGTQSEMIYIGRRQETIAQWAVLCPMFEVCAR